MPPKPFDATLGMKTQLSAADREAISKLSVLAGELTGVQLSDRHQAMIASRLGKRLVELELESLTDYLSYFQLHRAEETPKLIGLLTTHHTYFFREFSHFEFLSKQALPELIPIAKLRPDKKLKIWAAACSRGQEVYSLAMYLDLHLKKLDPSIGFEIVGTDIDPESVEIAKNGVYLRNELKEIPMSLLGNHWVKGTGDIESYAKAKKSLRGYCRFQTANLLNLKQDFKSNEKFDLIFCRNVFIYFNQEQINSITQELLSRMHPQGYFFIGISESLLGLKLPVKGIGPSVYRHLAKADVQPSQTHSMPDVAPVRLVSTPPIAVKPIRVLCVDDSQSIVTLLKKILSSEHGFEVVGVAKNGIEAAKQVAALKPDLLTLDIHMPDQTGIEYLEKNFKQGHPPVVMVTSVSRENSELAGRALSLGAADYVEKPSLTNMVERAEEIRTKLKCSLLASGAPDSSGLAFDRSFQKVSRIEEPEGKLRIVVMPLSARGKLKQMFAELTGNQPATFVFVEGVKDVIAAVAGSVSKELGRKVETTSSGIPAIGSGEIAMVDFSSFDSGELLNLVQRKKVSILVFGDLSQAGSEKLLVLQDSHLVLEDLGLGKGCKYLMARANDVGPYTSFAYLSNEYLSTGSNGKSQNEGKIRKAA